MRYPVAVSDAPAPEPIPLVDLGAEHRALRAELDAAIARVLDSGRFVLGPEVEAFEQELAAACGAKHAVGVSSGTDALLVSLMALEVGPGAEVVTTPFTFFATAGAIARLGARPVFADIEPESFNLDPVAAASACSERTAAVLPVHLYGRLAARPEVDLPILEDAAQSIGAGGIGGTAAALSFFPTKNVGALGDAGAVLTDDATFADRVRRLRAHGARPKYVHSLVGGNFRIDALQAAVLRVKLAHLGAWNRARRGNAERYRALLAAASLPPELRVPADAPEHTYHQFTLRAPRRDQLRAHLAAEGIATEIYYPQPLHLQECFAGLGYRPGSLPHAERAATEVLSLPIHPRVGAAAQARVVDRIAAFYRG